MSGGPPQRWTRAIDDIEEMSQMYGALSEEMLLQEMRERAEAMRAARNAEPPAGRRWWRRVAHRAR